MATKSQISATISTETKEKLTRFSRVHGLKKNDIVEKALLLFMEVWREIPEEALIPTRVVLDDTSFDEVARRLEKPHHPTKALLELMRER